MRRNAESLLRAGRHRTTPPVGRPRPPHRRHPRRPRRGRGLPTRHRPRRGTGHHHRLGRSRPRPPPRRAGRERPRVLATNETVDIRGRNRPGRPGDDPVSPGYTLAIINSASACRPATSRRPTAGSRAPRASPWRHPKYLGHYAGRQPRRPPRHPGHARQLARQRHHGHARPAAGTATSDSELASVPAPPGREAVGEHAWFAPMPALPVGVGRAAPADVPRPRSTPPTSTPSRRPGAPPRPPNPPAAGPRHAHPHGQRPRQALAPQRRHGPRRRGARRRAAGQPVQHRQQPAQDGAAGPAGRAGCPRPARRHGARATNPWTPPAPAERPTTNRSWPAPPDLGGLPRLPPAPAAPRCRPAAGTACPVVPDPSRNRRPVTPQAGPRRAAWPAACGARSCPRRSR